MDTSFIEWLTSELKHRKWSLRELSRRVEVSHSHLSKILLGRLPVSCEIAIRLAKTLDYSPDVVLRLAGILPPESAAGDDQRIQEALDILRGLPDDQVSQVVDYLRFLRLKRHRQDE